MELLQTNGPLTLYYQVEQRLRERIFSGQYKPGSSLPSENSLTSEFGVSRITIRRALNHLEEDGLILRRQGVKTIVSPHIPYQPRKRHPSWDFRGLEDELRQQGLHPNATLLESVEGEAPSFIAELLAVPADSLVVRIRRLGKLEETPIWLESRYFPEEIGLKVNKEDLSHKSILTILTSIGVDIGEVEMHLEAAAATERQAKLLKINPGDPLLLHQSITYSPDMKPVQVNRVYLRGDHYKLILKAQPQKEVSGLKIIGGGYLVTDGHITGENRSDS